MAPRSQLIRLRDILDNIDTVTDMVAGVDLAAYRRDVKLRRAVERCVEIISEASRHIPGFDEDEISGPAMAGDRRDR